MSFSFFSRDFVVLWCAHLTRVVKPSTKSVEWYNENIIFATIKDDLCVRACVCECAYSNIIYKEIEERRTSLTYISGKCFWQSRFICLCVRIRAYSRSSAIWRDGFALKHFTASNVRIYICSGVVGAQEPRKKIASYPHRECVAMTLFRCESTTTTTTAHDAWRRCAYNINKNKPK